MGRPERKNLIQEIERLRSSRVLCYVTGDRSPATGQIGDDAVRPMYDHLREMGHVKRLDLFIYSRGGAIDVPWRIVTALRKTSDDWNILIPFRANSAATLMALGADKIILGRQGELGPIDPIMSISRMVQQQGGPVMVQENVNVEDVMSYVKFVEERGRLSDQAALSNALSKLTERLDAVALGNAYRTHSHIRSVARRMLQSRKKKATEQEMATIIETLTERVYAHGHAIGFREAGDIGLPVESAPDELDDAMWRLLNDYEDEMKLLNPIDPLWVVGTTDPYVEETSIAAIESTWAVSRMSGQLEIRGKRQMPPNFTVNMNLSIGLPPNTPAEGLPEAVTQAIQQLLAQGQQAILQLAQQAVQQAMKEQAPLIGADARFGKASWHTES